MKSDLAVRKLKEVIESGEDWLMARILEYARQHDYTKYTSTLIEAWRMSIQGLSESLLTALEQRTQPMELGPEEKFRDDPAARFGILEARLHRDRGIALSMFMGLLKYYRQSYVDRVVETVGTQEEVQAMRLMVDRFFDRVEIGYLEEWTSQRDETLLSDLQARNRDLANEKNRYLTVFESLRTPTILLDERDRIAALNGPAGGLVGETQAPGAQYYRGSGSRQAESGTDIADSSEGDPRLVGGDVTRFFPWLKEGLASFRASEAPHNEFRARVEGKQREYILDVTLARMPDVSGKFAGTVVVMDDVTVTALADREQEELIAGLIDALRTVKTLKGFIPICSSCRRIRDDEGFWAGIENYLATHSDAQLTHGICSDCAKELYGEFLDE